MHGSAIAGWERDRTLVVGRLMADRTLDPIRLVIEPLNDMKVRVCRMLTRARMLAAGKARTGILATAVLLGLVLNAAIA